MKYVLTILLVFILFVSSISANKVYAQSFKFQLATPATPAASVGSNFDVKVLINTAGKQTLGADAIVVFDSGKLGINSAQKGTFYEVFQDHSIGGTTNKYLLSAWQTTELNPVSTSTETTLATLTLNAKTSGSATLSFDCTTGSVDSNIWDTNQADILKCADSQPLTIAIGGPGPTSTPSATLTPGPTSTPIPTSPPAPPRPTSTPVPTNTPRPTIAELPRTGAAEVTVAALGMGLVLTVIGILVIL